VIHLRVVSPPDLTPTVVGPEYGDHSGGIGHRRVTGVRQRERGQGLDPPVLLNVTVLAAVAIAGLPVQRAVWRRVARRATAATPG
jgi:hypothetical protein